MAWLLLLPAAVLLAAFTYVPALGSALASLYSTPHGARPARFVGLDNYAAMAADPVFWRALQNSVVYAAGTVPLAIGLALAMALLVNGSAPGRGLLRTAFFLPTVLPMIAVANIWLFFFTQDYGLVDQLLGLAGVPPRNWLGGPHTVLGCMMAVAVWKEAGFFMIFYLAALQTIPPNLREAAAIDGDRRFYVFRRVTLPLLMPTTVFVAVNALINAFRLVDHVIVMTNGGPDNASNLLLYYVYEVAFKFWDTSYAAALTLVLLVILATLAFTQFAVLDRRTHCR
ncbi:carbohydrate ABC transporter permease [Lichenibacterium ramalinae]|uniref:Sugar ABC transporter permease n=1 Tax=Lichenibacterium ramalinae TaxID=2316527 RepID=A0A4Q2RGF6_9HYPH|nr:sugar ABC transporter permease [Lichenibacterium ramalinae]RYB07316.1 sugar ABC transporter permease [Lichenibacterium ramalinae]